MLREDLAEDFKKPDSELRLVFVCAMWITGFDVPTCSTIYLDKPMRAHTLMQTIARANRVAPGKESGLIVDYVGIFRALQKALAIYAKPRPGSEGEASDPIETKLLLVAALREALEDAQRFCEARGIDLPAVARAQGFERIGRIDDAIEAILRTDEGKKRYVQLAGRVARLFKAILPDPMANELAPMAILVVYLAAKLRAETDQPDISAVVGDIESLLNDSIATEGYHIDPPGHPEALVNLSEIDFKALQEKFARGRKHTETEKLRRLIEGKLEEMMRLNPSRVDFADRFQKLIDEYNSGSRNVEELFGELVKLAKSLTEEERRSVAEGLSEEELALFDILTKPSPVLASAEEAQVKRVCRSLLESLKREKLVLDWREKQVARAAVMQTIKMQFGQLPPAFDRQMRSEKLARTYAHVYDHYIGEGDSSFQAVALAR